MNFKNLSAAVRQFYFSKRLIWGLLAVGILLRLRQYAFNRSLWSDEAALAVSFVTRTFSEIFLPLEGQLVVPFGFLISEKLTVQLLGPSEYALRFLPLLAGILALVLFYKVIVRMCDPAAVPLALGIFAICGPLVYFSSEIKQYSFDVLITVVILLLAVKISQAPPLQWPQVFVYGLWGAATVWFSHPSIFVLTAAGLVLAVHALQRKQFSIKFVGMFSLWFASFFITYVLSKQYMSAETQKYLTDYWKDGFIPLGPLSVENLQWYGRVFLRTFDSPGGFSPTVVAAVAFCGGVISYLLQKKLVGLGFLLMPIVLTLVASALRIYPFSERLILFIAPLLIILVAQGAVTIHAVLGPKYRILGVIFLVLLLAVPVKRAFSYAVRPMSREEIRPVTLYLKSKIRPGDQVYIYYGARRGFKYYSALYHFTPELVLGERFRENRQAYIQELRQLRGKPRVWLLFSHVFVADGFDERQFMLEYMDTVGRRLDQFEVEGSRLFGSKGLAAESSVYLYDLSQTVTNP